MTVKFEKVAKYKDIDFNLPKRKTKFSAGYDFEVPEDMIVPSITKHWLKLVEGRLSDINFLLEFQESDLFNELEKEIGGKEKLSETEQEQLMANYFTPFIQMLFNSSPLTLDEIKMIAKTANARATLVPTGVKAKLKDNQKLELLIRSSTPLNSLIVMANSVGIIDADYYNNEDNEGHIYFQLLNLSPFDIQLKKGDIIGQGIISSYDVTDDDKADGVRAGGFGSTNEEGDEISE